MTTYIPEWGPVAGPGLYLRRLFNDLGDAAVLRKPLAAQADQPEYFIESGGRWLAIALCRERYAAIGAEQLFDGDARQAFLNTLASLAAAVPELPKLVVMWACSEPETRRLAPQLPPGVTLCSREQLQAGGAAALHAALQPLSHDAVNLLKRRYFPEAEISAVNVGRRRFQRDNSASLTGVFLDREQEWASKLDLDVAPENEGLARDVSVRLLNGVAGSGKTLIALQRAILLATREPEQPVLFLITNTPVVADLAERIARAGRVLPANIDMCTFAAWANRQWRRTFGVRPELPQSPRELLALLRRLRQSAPPLRLHDQQLIEEIDYLNDALIAGQAEYLAAERAGRGFALREAERRLVWDLYVQLTGELEARGVRLWSAVASDICRAGKPQALRSYQHILVDEAQFLAPASLQLIKQSLKPGGSLFLCADPNQGFMRNRLSWKSVGLEVAGRTRKLRRSYRTTRTLLRSATTLLTRVVADDPEDFLAPDFAGMEEGVMPLLVQVDSPHDALDRVVNEIAALARNPQFPLSTILVLYGDAVPKAMLYQCLCRSLGPQRVWWLNKKENRKMPPGGYGSEHLRLASLDSATGLEATFVFLVGVDSLLAPGLGKPASGKAAESDARKLYMAMTRSCYRLSVIASATFDPASFAGIFDKRA